MGADLLISREAREKDERETPTYYPTEDEKKLIALIKRHYRDKEMAKRAYEKTWFVNMSFLRGQHY